MAWAATTPGFGLDNLPYGVFSTPDAAPRVGVRVGDTVLDLSGLTVEGLLPPECGAATLNPLMGAGRSRWAEVRASVAGLISDESDRDIVEPWLLPLQDVRLHLPFAVADYVDFYSSESHARNVGRMFRPDAEPLLENWTHLPVGYHGRSGTVVVSGTPIRRPRGQRRGPDGPVFGPSTRLDFELEVGFVVGTPSTLGAPVPVDEAEEHLFGVVLLNDWSARDLQEWEYVPLGPFLGKSFATTISAWVVPMVALADARVAGPPQDPAPLPHLQRREPAAFDVDLMASVSSEGMREAGTAPHVLARTNLREMYWTVAQQVAHLTSNGASLRTGDLLGTGTVSGSEPGSFGSLLETSWNGTTAIELPDGTTRTFLEDGDEVVLAAGTGSIALGEARGVIVG
ncbi:MAG TPA: fumarylacetoacetase [Acidimicrobiia bacterium]|nr:fumarylacetoacetase [Acidimicrobiia bacterium]